jgi:hypothetical protein
MFVALHTCGEQFAAVRHSTQLLAGPQYGVAVRLKQSMLARHCTQPPDRAHSGVEAWNIEQVVPSPLHGPQAPSVQTGMSAGQVDESVQLATDMSSPPPSGTPPDSHSCRTRSQLGKAGSLQNVVESQ